MQIRKSVVAMFMAGALAACGQEEDTPDQVTGLGDAAQPSAAADAAGTDASALDAAVASPAAPDASGTQPSADAQLDGAQPRDASVGAVDASLDATAQADATRTDAMSVGADASAVDYAPCPAAEPCKILPLGDSITYGLGYAGGYRVELFRKASADRKRITFLGSLQNGPAMVDGQPFPKNNEGHSGWTIDRIAGLVPTPALQGTPHIVLLMAGTNDVNLSTDLPNAPKRLGALIDKISAADAETLIVVAQITPLASRGQGASSPVNTFNAALPEVVATRARAGKHVLLVNMNEGFPANALGDGVHPNKLGYDWMAGVWYQAIGPLLR